MYQVHDRSGASPAAQRGGKQSVAATQRKGADLVLNLGVVNGHSPIIQITGQIVIDGLGGSSESPPVY